MAYYAQLDSDNKVKVICDSPLLQGDNIVEITSFDESLMGKTYNRETGQFE